MNRFGIRDTALNWFRSYLQLRKQFVSVNGIDSSLKYLQYRVPQGSVLGPLLYSLYTSPLGDIATKYRMAYHFICMHMIHSYIHLSFTSNCPNHTSNVKETVELCVIEILATGCCVIDFSWIKIRRTLRVSSRYRPRPLPNHIQIGDDVISPCEHARNLGVGFDQHFHFSEHVKMTCKIAFSAFAKIRRYWSHDTAKTIVHAYKTLRLDYYNALYYGLPKYLIDRIQLVQNSAARLITASRKHDHITPILRRYDLKASNGQAPSYNEGQKCWHTSIKWPLFA